MDTEFQDESRNNASHIFVSYSRIDLKNVDWIARQLAAGGYETWIDRRDIPGGVDWSDTIETAILEAEAFVLMVSPNSIASTEVYRELEIAHERDIRIIPVILRPVKEMPELISKIVHEIQNIVFWRRRQAFVGDLITSLGGLRGVASVMPSESTVTILENARLIAELLRIAQEVTFGNAVYIFEGGDLSEYYVQFNLMRDSSQLYAEAVGNENLSEETQLGDEQISILKEFGWQEPRADSAGNYWQTWQAFSNRDRAAVAATVMNTFLDVYGHPWGEHIQIEMIDLS